MSKEAALKETSKILELILKDELTEEEKDMIVQDSINNFNNHVNPGWLVSKIRINNAAFVEWALTGNIRDVYGEPSIAWIRFTTADTEIRDCKYVQAHSAVMHA